MWKEQRRVLGLGRGVEGWLYPLGGAGSGGVSTLRVAVGLSLEDPPLGVGENGPGQRPGPRVWPGAEGPTQGGLGGVPTALQSLGGSAPPGSWGSELCGVVASTRGS